MSNNNFYGPSQLGYSNNNNPNINANNQFGYTTNNQQNMGWNNQQSNNMNNKQSHSTFNQYSNQSPYNNQYQPLNSPYQPSNNNQGGQNGGNLFADIIKGGGLNHVNNLNQNQNGNQNQNNNQQSLEVGMNLWKDLVKNIDWDTILKDKNFTKKQSDTSWITYQQESWKQQKPSDYIQKQADRKFAFPNQFIKYKIIPGVDQKMALDVTSRDDLESGLVRGNLIIWDYHGGPNQQFYIHRCGPNTGKIEDQQFILINAATGFVVSAISLNAFQKKNDSKNQNMLCVYPKIDQNPAQRWRLKPIDQHKQIFMIESVKTNKVLDCFEGRSKNGTNVIQWSMNRGKNQIWKILPA